MPESKDPKIRVWRRLQRYYQRVIDRAMKRDAYAVARRYRRKRKWLTRKIRHRRKVLSIKPTQRTGVVWFDGVRCAAWMAPYLSWARAHGWNGHLVSGWRDPVYSESLCFRMCSAPRCPGRCAGRSSNHSGSVKPRGAVDVSDYYRFAQVISRCPYEPRIFNALPNDRVHFSSSGQLVDPVAGLLLLEVLKQLFT